MRWLGEWYPPWMGKDGYILKVVNPGYVGVFRWHPPMLFDVMIHSTPARTKGHEWEIALHTETWEMVAAFKEDMLKELFG